MTNLHQINNNENYNNNSSKPPPYQHRSLKGINWVIFPQNQYVQLESPRSIVLSYEFVCSIEVTEPYALT